MALGVGEQRDPGTLGNVHRTGDGAPAEPLDGTQRAVDVGNLDVEGDVPGPPAGGSPIARLVLEPEPSAERGHVERLFPLVEARALADVERRLGYLASRHIRVGVARWFVFDKATVSEEAVTVTGTVRAYNASVDTLNAEPTLSAAPSEAPVELVLRRDEALLIARRCTAQIARAAVALRTATKVRPLGHIPYHVAQLDGSAAAFAAPSLFLLDVLANRLRRAGLGPPNLAVARFKLGE